MLMEQLPPQLLWLKRLYSSHTISGATHTSIRSAWGSLDTEFQQRNGSLHVIIIFILDTKG